MCSACWNDLNFTYQQMVRQAVINHAVSAATDAMVNIRVSGEQNNARAFTDNIEKEILDQLGEFIASMQDSDPLFGDGNPLGEFDPFGMGNFVDILGFAPEETVDGDCVCGDPNCPGSSFEYSAL